MKEEPGWMWIHEMGQMSTRMQPKRHARSCLGHSHMINGAEINRYCVFGTVLLVSVVSFL